MSTLAVQPRITSNLAGSLLGGLSCAILAIAIAAFLLTAHQYSAAKRLHPWMRAADQQRTFVDRFRFALTPAEEVAGALAPAAVAGLDAVPLEISHEMLVGDVGTLIGKVNQ